MLARRFSKPPAATQNASRRGSVVKLTFIGGEASAMIPKCSGNPSNGFVGKALPQVAALTRRAYNRLMVGVRLQAAHDLRRF